MDHVLQDKPKQARKRLQTQPDPQPAALPAPDQSTAADTSIVESHASRAPQQPDATADSHKPNGVLDANCKGLRASNIPNGHTAHSVPDQTFSTAQDHSLPDGNGDASGSNTPSASPTAHSSSAPQASSDGGALSPDAQQAPADTALPQPAEAPQPAGKAPQLPEGVDPGDFKALTGVLGLLLDECKSMSSHAAARVGALPV